VKVEEILFVQKEHYRRRKIEKNRVGMTEAIKE
jgi:hypothetical protein